MPFKASGKTDLSIHPSHRVEGSNVPTSGAVNKPVSDARHPSADCGHSDSSPSSYDVASPLHFFGLAATQTQTQVASCAEESGKGSLGSESKVAKRRKVAHDPNVHSPSGAPSRASSELSGMRSKSRPASKLKRRRSPSVDSFAEADEWEDPAKVFLATNRQFEVPLSELGRGATHEGCPSTIGTPPEPTQIDLPRSPSPRRFPASGSRVRTKVQRTGDHSDDAISQVSGVSRGAPARNQSPESDISDIPDEASTPPVMSNPGLLDHIDTQAEDYQATQPLAEEDLETNTTQVVDASDSHARQPSPPAWSSTTSRPSTNTRNILGMVNPMKKWRHQRGQQLQQAALHSVPDEQTQPSADFSASSHATTAGRRLFEELAAHLRAEQQSTPQDGLDRQNHPHLPVVDEGSHETVVVPDSEPSEPANVSSTPAQPDASSPPKASLHDRPVDSSLSRPASAAEQNDVSKHAKTKDGMIDDDDDDDDEDDIPLSLVVSRPATSFAPPSMKASDPRKPKAGPSRVDGRAKHAPGVKISRTRGTDTGDKEIPSSVPQQDRRSPTASPRSLTQPRTGPRPEDEEREDTMEDAFIPDVPSDRLTPVPDEDTTEPADDLPIDSMDTGDDVHPPRDSKVPSSRRRPVLVPLRKAAYKSAARGTSKTPSTATAVRALNRNSHHPTATRVFALWKQAAAYFSGIVYERVGQSDRFKINFDDGDADVLDVKNLRRLELQVGDRISIIESQEKATIANVDKQQHGFVTAQLVDDPTTEFEVEVVGIKIQSRAVGSQWGNRVFSADDIVTLMSTIKTETPTSLRNSSTNLNKKRVLTKVGIVVTMSVGSDWEKEKETVMRTIKTNGGTVLDDWSDVFSLAGEYSANKKRWVITSDNVGIEMKHDIQQVFLVSDAANTKPRFLTALALGIPCLSVEWLRHLSSGQCAISDWPHYLLPAGYSDSLGARVTQMVDLDWGTTLDHLTGIMSNNVATKLFSKKSVLILGPEYFPPPAKGKKGSSGVGGGRSSDGGQFISRIIVSMGAARVEAVPELKYSSHPDLKDFQFVVVKDMHERPPVGGEKYVSMEWVKDCLIAGRMFPPRV